MYTLAFDTSSRILSVALLAHATGETFVEEREVGHGHGEQLALFCDAVLIRAGASYNQISRIVIGSGPGSFTGLRIGYSFAKGLASALRVPCFPYSSFHAFHLSNTAIKWVIGDARSAFFFVGLGDQLPILQTESELLSRLRAEKVETVLTLDTLPLAFSHVQRVAPRLIAEELLKIDAIHGKGNDSGEALSELTPLYLRPVSAKTIAERRID